MKGLELYKQMREDFDFTTVIETAVRELDVPTYEKAEELMDAFLQWFSLIPMLGENDALQMLRSVDKLWHAFILNTKLYREFCHEYVGSYIDHDPTEVTNTELPKEKYAAFTLKLLKEQFGNRVQPSLQLLKEDSTCCYFKKQRCKTRTEVVRLNQISPRNV